MYRRFVHPLRLVILALILVSGTVSTSLPATPALSATTLPSGFSDELVANATMPTALAFTPDGRLLIAEQTGKLLVYSAGTLLATPALDLSAVVCTNSERGLVGIAVDPNFASNHAIFLYYTYNPFVGEDQTCPLNQPLHPHLPINRLSRFTLGDNNLATGETVLLDNIPSSSGSHNAGDLHFGADGYLYVSVGDGGADYQGDSGIAGQNDATRDQFILLGKLLRITRDGGIPPDNPFVGADSGRCNVSGRTSKAKCQETFAWGLRNPFRFAIRPGSNQIYINDVGEAEREEINLGQAGADYGWNCKEGTLINSTTNKCNPLPAHLVDPIFEYQHGNNPAPSPFQNCNSITGGAFVPSGVWPAPYDQSYLFADWICGTIFRLIPNNGNGASAEVFAGGLDHPTAIVFGPYKTTQALYYTSSVAGQIRRIALNSAPNAMISATPSSGAAPLQVAFSSAGSSDPDDDTLTYDWDFGDGSAHASGATTTHDYAYGLYNATLTVSDGRGGTDSAAVFINSGNIVLDQTLALPLIGKP